MGTVWLARVVSSHIGIRDHQMIFNTRHQNGQDILTCPTYEKIKHDIEARLCCPGRLVIANLEGACSALSLIPHLSQTSTRVSSFTEKMHLQIKRWDLSSEHLTKVSASNHPNSSTLLFFSRKYLFGNYFGVWIVFYDGANDPSIAVPNAQNIRNQYCCHQREKL